jgi:3-hydroxyacyl-CoA dehydrogenase
MLGLPGFLIGSVMSTGYHIRGPVAVITFSNPPANVLSHEIRKGIFDSLEAARENEGIKAVIIAGSGNAFSAGADIREFNTTAASADPHIRSVIQAIEECPKPVIAAVHSVCLGAGLELAMACHYRIAVPGTRIGLPEIKLGLAPGAGGTQRLPRILGLEAALNLILSGEEVPAESLAGTPLFDTIIDEDLLEGAIKFAGKIIDEKRGLPKIRDIRVDYPNYEALFQFVRTSIKATVKHYPAPLKCIESVEASVTMPFDEGIVRELDNFLELVATPQSRALIHAFFAEKTARIVPDLPETIIPRPIRKAAIIGAGMMGSGIAMAFLNAGIPVTVLDVNQEVLDRGIMKIRGIYEVSIKNGKFTRESLEQRMSLLSTALDYEVLKDSDIAIEAVFEDMQVKKEVFEKLDHVMKPGAILATNTSTLDLNRIAGFTRRPRDVVGAHFFSPAQVMKLLEVVRGTATAKDVLATAMALAKALKKVAVISGVCDGFIGNRMMKQYARQAEFLLEEGCTPEQVDKAIEGFGFAMGPFRVADLVGNDVVLHIRKREIPGHSRRCYSKMTELLCDMKRYGQKAGAGWYDYKSGNRRWSASPVVEEMIKQQRARTGMNARKITGREIVDRLVHALINEAARILEEGIALRSSDIDIVFLLGYGFPPWRGGPLHYANTIGLSTVLRRMKQFAANPNADPEFWNPAPLIKKLAAEGGRFGEG